MGDNIPRLTDRQDDVFELLLQGKEQKEIARRFDISPKTVNTHVMAIYDAFSVSSHAMLILRALRLGLLASVPDIASPVQPNASGVGPNPAEVFPTEQIGAIRQRPAFCTRPSPVVERAGDAPSQDGMTAAAEPTHGADL